MAFPAGARDPARKVVAVGGEGERDRARQLGERLEGSGLPDAEPADHDRDAGARDLVQARLRAGAHRYRPDGCRRGRSSGSDPWREVSIEALVDGRLQRLVAAGDRDLLPLAAHAVDDGDGLALRRGVAFSLARPRRRPAVGWLPACGPACRPPVGLAPCAGAARIGRDDHHRLAAERVVGSATVQPTKTRRQKPSSPASARGITTGSANRGLLRLLTERSAQIVRCHAGSLANCCGTSQHGRKARKRSGAAERPPRLVSQRG